MIKRYQIAILLIILASCNQKSNTEHFGISLDCPDNSMSIILIDKNDSLSNNRILIRENDIFNPKEVLLFQNNAEIAEITIGWMNNESILIEYPNDDPNVIKNDTITVNNKVVHAIYKPYNRAQIKSIKRSSHNRNSSEIEIVVNEKYYNSFVALAEKKENTRLPISRDKDDYLRYFKGFIEPGTYRLYLSEKPNEYHTNYFEIKNGESIKIELR